jgi:hypothetical protein
VKTGSELLDLRPAAPLSVALVARPARALVLVPAIEGTAWQLLVEHALAVQTGVWGGNGNLVVPTGWELADDEIFWRIIDLYDPDFVALHTVTVSDFGEIAPEQHAERMKSQEIALVEGGWDDAQRAAALQQLQEEPLFMCGLTDRLAGALIDRVAPLHYDGDVHDMTIDGTSPPHAPFTDVARLWELPERVWSPSAEDPVDRLLLTQAFGRVVPSLRMRLAVRGIRVEEQRLDSDAQVALNAWPRRVTELPPRDLSGVGLMRRIAIVDGGPVVVVGDEPRDFLLFNGLSRLRPAVYWLPAAKLESDMFVMSLHTTVTADSSFEATGNQVAITSATNPDAAAALAERWPALGRGRRDRDAVVVPWTETLPRRPMAFADGSSERRVALVSHEAETSELPAVYPVAVSTDDPMALSWMVDVEVRGWTPIRHPRIGASVLQGAWVSSHDARSTLVGASYNGQAGFVMAGVPLESTAARPTLAPLDLVDQLRAALTDGWEVGLSDKGAYAIETARIFGGVEGLVAALRDPATRRVLDAFKRGEGDEGPGLFLKDSRRWYLSLDEVAILAPGGASAVLEDLHDRDALLRGHALKCEHCRATSFYALDEHQRFTCVRCRREQRATRFSWLKKDPEPRFRYALAEVAYQFLRHNGHLPLLATYDHFAAGSARERQVLDVAFEVEIRSPDGVQSEHDIVASSGANLWLGEATLESTFGTRALEPERLARLRDVAVQLSARGILLVTTSERFDSRTRGNVENAFRDQWVTVRYVEGFDAGPSSAA